MNLEQIANQLTQWRTQARTVPKRHRKRLSETISLDLLRIALAVSLLLAVGLFLYASYQFGGLVYYHASIAFAARFGILSFCLMVSAPILGRALSWNPAHRAKAYAMMQDSWFAPYHVCIFVLVCYVLLEGIRYALPYGVAVWNVTTGDEVGLPSLTPLDLYVRWLGISLVTTAMYEAYLFFAPQWSNRFVQHRTSSAFGLWVGKSTGLLAKREHGAGLQPRQHISLSLRDATHHLLILGGTGAGKTTRMINPLLMQLMAQDCGGLVFDIKGDFHHTVYDYARALGQEKRIVPIGINGQSINLIEGLNPEMAGSFLKSTLVLSHAGDSFWVDSATTLCTNVLGILSFLPDKYDLISVYDFLFNARFKNSVMDEIKTARLVLDTHQLRALTSYCDYVESTFESFEDKTKSGVKATAAQILAPLVQAPALGDAFCQPSSLKMEKVLDGTIYLVDVPLSEWGLGGKVIYNFIKMRFFNVMQKRRSQSLWNQHRPVFFLCDEYQQIATGDKDSLSDLTFWDTARSTNTIGIISTQSISSFYAAIGNTHVANAILQNFRQKFCFRTEDEATLRFFNQVVGTVEVEKKSTSQQRGTSSNTNSVSLHTQHSRSESITHVDKPVIDAQLVRNLKPEQAVAVLVMQGHSCDDIVETVSC